MTVAELIEKKRDGQKLNGDEIAWLITSYTSDEVADYQMAAMLMAIFIRGLDGEELAAWTEAMLYSGDTLDFSDIDMPRVTNTQQVGWATRSRLLSSLWSAHVASQSP